MVAPTGSTSTSSHLRTIHSKSIEDPSSFSRDELIRKQYISKGSKTSQHRLSDAIAKKPTSPRDELLFKHYTNTSNKTNEHRFYPKTATIVSPSSSSPSTSEQIAANKVNSCCAGNGATQVQQEAAANEKAGSAPQEGGTPVTDGAPSASGKQAVAGATDPKAADGDTKADPKKTETEKKETNATPKQEEGGIMKGWIKTKVGLGAALLAGGIALKMTLIGIIPGLIMAGAGAALMGWGSINYFMKDKQE